MSPTITQGQFGTITMSKTLEISVSDFSGHRIVTENF